MTTTGNAENIQYNAPLATRMRPRHIDEFVGQQHLLAPGKPLRQAIEQGRLYSMIFWGPPGTGKTTLAELMARYAHAEMVHLSAVLSGVADIRKVIQQAETRLQQDKNAATILFVDEIHRFNKAQQDVFLPHIERGTIILLGATTENPSFQLNNALLSRMRVYVLKPLLTSELLTLLQTALLDVERGFGARHIEVALPLLERITEFADGDARQCLNLLEILADFTEMEDGREVIKESAVEEVLKNGLRRFDKQGDLFYEQISALHKSVRGSDPDASLYWLTRMLDGGCDREFLARRLVRMASEDVGNADPRALRITLDAWEAYERLGTPEGELGLAQAVVYLACAPKSNAVYKAYNLAMQDAKQFGSLSVPLHLTNAPTGLMKQLGYGKGYRYDHDEPDAYAAGQRHFPENMPEKTYYQPVERGLEIQIKEKLDKLLDLKKKAGSKK